MESALQVDLARSEAPAEQVLDSALGQIATPPNVLSSPAVAEGKPHDKPEHMIRGRSETTAQVRLVPKIPKDQRSRSPSTQDLPTNTLESGNFDGIAQGFSLQPVDEGFGAWSYAASAFAMFIVVWGFPQAFPVFQTHLSSQQFSKHADSVILPLLAPGLQDIEEGILFQILPKAARYRQTLVLIGITILLLSLVLASYAREAWQIVLTQGIFYGIGGILLNFVHVSIFSEWFDKKRSQAMSIIWLGYRVGGLAFPLICQWLLDQHGYETTLRVLLAPMLALLLPTVVLFRGRYPASTVVSKPVQPPVSKLATLRNPSVAFYLLVALLFAFVTNVPMMFITKFAAEIEMYTFDQALALSLVFGSNVVGTYVIGQLSDRGFIDWLMGGSAVLASLIHFLVWGLAKTKTSVFIYAICIGLTNGGFHNCLFSFFSEVSGNDSELFTTIHSLFSFFEGWAILSVGPVGTALLNLSPRVEIQDYAIGRYKYLVLYAGGMTMTSGLLVLIPVMRGSANRLRGQVSHQGIAPSE
ncbi:MAG: hypothetical protein ALECFALPRED_001705 [Alectoria fallacina]|uniref:Uncharacterized protein n=1 Tax=Alectoria fallacina TaxID=1903189 RepID=A0A8H3IHJ3_9LECA|nr:MAG: hypothetical protein ALECFALPRED_001705 [Alectoria fallacina]